jgi:prevent-host-death family protein
MANLAISAKIAKINSRGVGLKTISYRNRRGEQVEAASLTATEAKNEFGKVLETVMQDGIVVITKHDAPKAVLISIDEFEALSQAPQRDLDSLTREFDALFERMQTPKARAGMKAAFSASPKKLSKAAVSAASKPAKR